jgi:hypothetical protein
MAELAAQVAGVGSTAAGPALTTTPACYHFVNLLTFLQAGLQLEHQPLRSLSSSQDGALIYKADLQSTLHDVVLYGFLQPDSAGCLRVRDRESATQQEVSRIDLAAAIG